MSKDAPCSAAAGAVRSMPISDESSSRRLPELFENRAADSVSIASLESDGVARELPRAEEFEVDLIDISFSLASLPVERFAATEPGSITGNEVAACTNRAVAERPMPEPGKLEVALRCRVVARDSLGVSARLSDCAILD